jgi:Uncharacterised protein family (UPF0233).
VPESKVRKAAAEKKKLADRSAATEADKHAPVAAPGSRAWVVPTFITVGLLGVLWLVVFYITASVGITIPGFSALGSWNVLIGMGLMAGSFALATLWK